MLYLLLANFENILLQNVMKIFIFHIFQQV